MGNFKDLTGQRFGMLEVLERDYSFKKRTAWICKCDCGKIISKIGIYLTTGQTKSCGSHKAKDIVNEKFGRLTVIKRVEDDKYQNARWLCRCDCGNYVERLGIDLRSGRSKSCGCLTRELRKKHRKEYAFIRDPLYWRYTRIKSRCYNIKNPRYKDYGGRGITVCDEWKNDFMSFYNWSIENGYKDDLTIDRIDVNGNYEPSNCRWVDRKVQANNKRNNIIVNYNNTSMTLKQWSELLGLNYKLVFYNYRKGIKLEKIPEIIENNKINKAVIIYNKNGEKIKEFSCVNQAIDELKMAKNQRASIYACLNGRQKTAHGYIWGYTDEHNT